MERTRTHRRAWTVLLLLIWAPFPLVDSQTNPGMTPGKRCVESLTPYLCLREMHSSRLPLWYFESLKGIQLSSIWEGMCYFSTLRIWLCKKGFFLMQDKMLKLLSQFECDRHWRTISVSPISLTDQNSCIWSHVHSLLRGCDRGKKWDLWGWLRWRAHCKVGMLRAQGGRGRSCSSQSHSSSLWETERCKSTEKVKLGLGGRVWQVLAHKLHAEVGRHTWSHRRSHACRRHSTREWAVGQAEEQGLENYHTKILNSGSGNSIAFVGYVTRKATHTLEAS